MLPLHAGPLPDAAQPLARVKARARTGSIEIAYDDLGAGDRPLVLLHGFFASRDDWHDLLPRLAAHGRTLALDLPGHGESGRFAKAADYTVERLADRVIGFLDALGVERCDVVGHSLGALVARALAIRHPARVASLLLMSTSVRPLEGAPRGVYEGAARIVRDAGIVAFYEIGRAAVERSVTRPSVARSIRRMGAERYWRRVRTNLLAIDIQAFPPLVRCLVDGPDCADRLGEITCPTTVIACGEDEPFQVECEALAARIPGARLVRIADAAHSPHIEHEAAWLDAVSRHLRWARGGA
ncbi:MAG: hypothetical protein DCC71_23105 [Proteobacteria bacterium]|nr:MAG: hypothetical protein DCC71_23105 [Pseudomonadota bacterium]